MIQACLHAKGLLGPQKVLRHPCPFMILPTCCAIRIIPEASHSQTSLGKRHAPLPVSLKLFGLIGAVPPLFLALSNSSVILVAQDTLFGVRGPDSPLSTLTIREHFLPPLGRGLGQRAIHQLFSRKSSLLIFQLISLTPFVYSRWIMAYDPRSRCVYVKVCSGHHCHVLPSVVWPFS